VRGKLVAAAAGVAAVLLTSGCGGRAAGVDGNLTNNWPAMPVAKLPVPTAPACFDVPEAGPGVSKLPDAVPCERAHNLETIHIGTFTGEDATRDAPPPGGGPAQQKAYAECAGAARDYLGGDWRDGRIDLDVVVPTSAQWEAEARWFRCDLLEINDFDSWGVTHRTATIRGGLTGDRPLALTCFQVTAKSEDIDKVQPMACGAAHNSEYTGTWEAPPGTYPADDAAREKLQLDGCRGVVARYTGVPNDDKFRYRVGQITFGFGKAAWDLGNRGARCYLWMSDKSYTKSLKGAGTGGLPINYA